MPFHLYNERVRTNSFAPQPANGIDIPVKIRQVGVGDRRCAERTKMEGYVSKKFSIIQNTTCQIPLEF